MPKPRWVRLAAMLALVVTTVAAQTNATRWNAVKALMSGTEVRFSNGSRMVRGEIIQVTDDSLMVNSGRGQEMFTQPEVRRMWVKVNNHRGRNMLIGLAAGATTGLILGSTYHETPCGFPCFGTLSKAGAMTLGTIGLGAAGGPRGSIDKP